MTLSSSLPRIVRVDTMHMFAEVCVMHIPVVSTSLALEREVIVDEMAEMVRRRKDRRVRRVVSGENAS